MSMGYSEPSGSSKGARDRLAMLFNRASYCPMNNQPCCFESDELAIDVLSRVSPRSSCRIRTLDLASGAHVPDKSVIE